MKPELWHLLADNLPQLAWIAEANGDIVWYNRRWYEYTGTTFEQMKGWGWRSVHHPDELERVEARFREALETGLPWEDVFPLRSQSGEYRQFLSRAQPVRGSDGEITNWFGTNTDITEQLAAERQSRYLLQLESILASSPNAEEGKSKVTRLLGEALGASRVHYSEPDLQRQEVTVTAEYLAEDVPSVAGTHRFSQPVIDLYSRGQPVVISDYRNDPAFAEDRDRPEIANLAFRAILDVPLVRDGKLVGVLSVHQAEPRQWTSAEVSLAVATAERSWDMVERARAEALREQAEKALDESNRRFQAVLDNTLMAVFLMDHRQHCVYANAAAEKLTGYSFAEMGGRPLHDVVHHKKPDGSHYPLEECPIDRAFPERAQVQGEELFVAPDGSFYPVAFTASPVLDDAGRPIGTVIEARNISEEKARVEALRSSEERFRFALEAAGGIGTWDWDVPGDMVTTSAQFARMYGVDPQRAAQGLPVGEYVAGIHEEDRAEVARLIEQAVAGQEEFRAEYRIVGADGDVRWVIARGRCLFDENGRAVRFPGVTFDITERRRTEEALRSSEAEFKKAAEEIAAIYQTAPIGLSVFDRDLRYVRVNQRLAEMNGLSASEHIGRSIREVVPDLADQAEPALRRVLAGEEIYNLEISGSTPADPDVVRTWRENMLPVRGVDGEIVGIAISAEDITRQKEAELLRREAEGRYRSVFNSAAVGIGRISPDGRFLEINDRYCEILKRSREQIISGGWREITHPEDLEGDVALVEQALAGEIDSYMLEKRYIGPDREDIWVNLTVSTERAEDGSVRFFIAVVQDIGERKAAEAALRSSEERYRTLFESMEQGFCVMQVAFDGDAPRDYRFTELNPAFTRHTGLSPAVLGQSVRDVVPDLEPIWLERYGKIARTGEAERFIDHAEALGRWFEVYAFRIGEPSEHMVAILFSDVSDRMRQEAALRASEQEMRLRLNAIPQMVWSTLPDGYHDFYNDRWSEFTGTPLGSTDGDGWNGMFHPDDQARAFERWRHSLETGEPYEIEYRLRHHTGAYRWVLGRALPIRAEDGAIVRWMGTCTDIDDRIEAERALRDSEARLRAVIEAMPVGLMFADSSGALTGCNQVILDYLGRDATFSSSTDDYAADYVAFHEDGRQVESHEYPLARALKGEDRPELECQILRGDGSLLWLRYVASAIRAADGEVTGGVVASIDIDREKRLTLSLEKEVEKVIAEREAAQEALRQSQKLEAMGQLTGGVAHDFNNLLTPIIGSLDLLQRKQQLDARTTRLVDGALASAEKARVLVQRLLAFARRQPLQPQAVDLSRIVSEMSELIASTSGPRVRVEVAVPPALPPALADGNQLEMALLNLAVNARDAMPEGGTLTIAVRAEDASAGTRLGLKAVPHLVLCVSDTGVGMDEETRRRAIEPFFSTKGIGKGTGLGLSMVHGLAAQLGGALDIRSAPGVGTSIELWLPVAGDLIAADAPGGSEGEASGAGLALLVDDEDLVRASTASMLADLGYEVMEASSGEEALGKVKEGVRPDLLVTDQLMPGLSGTDLAVRLRELLPGVPVLIVSGYADLESLSPQFPHLSKPFRQSELASALEKMAASDG